MMMKFLGASVIALLLALTFAPTEVGVAQAEQFRVAQADQPLLPPRNTQTAPNRAQPSGTVIEAPNASTVSSDTQISVGSWIKDLMSALWLALGGIVSAALVRMLLGAVGPLGNAVTDAMRQRLNDMVQNAIALAITRAGASLDGKIPIELHSQIAKEALEYVRLHGQDTLTGLISRRGWLGGKKISPQAASDVEETIEARVARFLQVHNKQMEMVDVSAPKPNNTTVLATPGEFSQVGSVSQFSTERAGSASPTGGDEPLFGAPPPPKAPPQPLTPDIAAMIKQAVSEALKAHQPKRLARA